MVRIFGHEVNGGARNMSPKEAKRIIKAEKNGHKVEPVKSKKARATAADHYATELDKLNRIGRKKGRS